MMEIEVTLTCLKDEEVKDVLQEITGGIKDNFPNVSYNINFRQNNSGKGLIRIKGNENNSTQKANAEFAKKLTECLKKNDKVTKIRVLKTGDEDCELFIYNNGYLDKNSYIPQNGDYITI